MERNDTLRILGQQIGVDLERDTFMAVLAKLSSSGMTSFRLNWTPNVTVCMAFERDGCQALNRALDNYLEQLEQSL